MVNEKNNALNASSNDKGNPPDFRDRRRYIFSVKGACRPLPSVASSRTGASSVTMQKFDPYLNVDPGTMNPSAR